LEWPVFVAGPAIGPEGQSTKFTHVDWLGSMPQADLANWMGLASIYALPARYEPFGLGPLEAALAGCALVLGDIPSLREIWGDNAIYIAPNNPEDLNRALSDLIRNKTKRESLAASSRQRAMELTPAKMAKGYADIYRELAARRLHPVEASLFQ
jgi:glycosyltransferase involved in cell wall biosynthesis